MHEKIREGLGGDVFQRLRDGFRFIAHRDADAPGSMIKSEDSHDMHSFTTNAGKLNDANCANFRQLNSC